MDQRTGPAPRLTPLAPEHTPELKEQFENSRKRMGFIPNSILIMQRNPKMVRGFTQMSAAIWDPEGKVDLKLKRLISHVASRSAGCKYCMAHTAEGASKLGVDQQKLDAVRRRCAREIPVYKRADASRNVLPRSSTFITDDAYHLVPRAVRMPRWLRA